MLLFYRARKHYNNPKRRYRVTPAAEVRHVAAPLCIHRVREATNDNTLVESFMKIGHLLQKLNGSSKRYK